MSSIPNCHYLSLLQSFDAVGWVPTIRDSLSLSLFDNSNSILGDVDKYSTEFQNYYDNFVSSRYLLASSLLSTDDYKLGKDYCRTFRYVFRGTINDTQRQSDFIRNNGFEQNFFEGKDLLTGKLSITVNISNKLTDAETELLQSLKRLAEKKAQFTKESFRDAASCERLQELRNELQQLWKTAETKAINIENIQIENNPVYKFDVVLSKDGTLFLKDDTNTIFRDTYREKNTPNDFTTHIPIHRLFKTAMNYIKFLFHKNYHHKEYDDTFLPVTNLYPIRQNTNKIKTEKIIRHQIEAFLRPVTALKRNNFQNFSCNPSGIIQYTESFLHVFENNGFISNKDADALHKFIEIQKNDIEILLSENNTVIGSFLTQKNILATITVSVGFLLAIIEIINYVCKVPEISTFMLDIPEWFVITVGLGIGFFLKKFTEIRILAKKFKTVDKKSVFKRFLNQDSNIKRKRLSFLYALKLSLIDLKLLIRKGENRELIAAFLLLLFILLSLLAASTILNLHFILH